MVSPPSRLGRDTVAFTDTQSAQIEMEAVRTRDTADGNSDGGDDDDDYENVKLAPKQSGFYWFVTLFVISAWFHSMMSLCVKLSSQYFSAVQIMWSRYAIQLLSTSLILVMHKKFTLGPSGTRGSLLARGVFGMLSQGCHILAISYMPLADAVSLHTVYPVITSLLAPAFLGEALTPVTVGAAVTGTTGCAFISKGRLQSNQEAHGGHPELGVVLALLGAFFASITYILIRKLMRQSSTPVDPEVVVWTYSVTAIVALSVGLPATARSFRFGGPAIAWIYLLGVGTSSVLEQLLVTYGFRGVPAGAGTLLLTMETGFAFLFSVAALHETPRWTTCMGGVLIVTAVSFTAWRQMNSDRCPDSERQKEAKKLNDPSTTDATYEEESQ